MNDLPTYIARRTRGLAIVLATVCFSSQASIAAILPDCEAIAAKVETATGLPQGILSSISRVESGHAWPGQTVRSKVGPGRPTIAAKASIFKSAKRH